MKNADALLAGFVLFIGIGYAGMAWWMPRGSIAYPGPGFFPVLVGLFMILTAGGCLVQAIAGVRPPDHSAAGGTPETQAGPTTPSTGKACWLLGLLVAYALCLKPLGFLIAIFLFLLASIRIFGYRRWLASLGITAAIAAISYVSFVIWLKVPLPLGILSDILD